jgi:hypothetical protein
LRDIVDVAVVPAGDDVFEAGVQACNADLGAPDLTITVERWNLASASWGVAQKSLV